MELLQCVNTEGPYKRAFHSEDREITLSSNSSSGSSRRAATLGGGERRVSLPHGHHYASASATLGRETRSTSFRHYGSSLSLADEHGTHELTSRTLRPPSPTTLRKNSTSLPPAMANANKAERLAKPSLPNMRVELESPKLADYLERPRLVNGITGTLGRNESAASASAHHAKRYENNMIPAYRNLRLGNFMEEPEANNEDEIIPERLRQYYLDTYLNVCDTCDSLDHCNPLSPIHRGM